MGSKKILLEKIMLKAFDIMKHIEGKVVIKVWRKLLKCRRMILLKK
jgi:hypothetical protein